MPDRLDVLKTYKLFIDGKFPRTESGRSWPLNNAAGEPVAHLSLASRKDLREGVEAARRAQPGWAGATPYNRGQVLYRMAEMLEGKRDELAQAIASLAPARSAKGKGRQASASLTPQDEVSLSIDRLVCFAGWADKYAQVLGCNNPVAGPFYNFTITEPTGVVACIAPDSPSLLGLISLLAPPLCAGNAVVVLSGGTNPIPAAVLGEVCATSDVPAGVVNILTGMRGELLGYVASHRDIDAIHAAGLSADERVLVEKGIAENLKRVKIHAQMPWTDAAACHSPWWIEPFIEFKTIWHPASV